MADKADRIKKTVTFTQEAADRLLLEAIESLLGEGQFDSFNGLCKQALDEFVSRQELALAGPGVLQFAHQLIELQRQFFEFKETVATNSDRRMEALENQVERLQKQLQQLTDQVDGLSASTEEIPAKRSNPAPNASQATEPLLKRLGDLLEDF